MDVISSWNLPQKFQFFGLCFIILTDIRFQNSEKEEIARISLKHLLKSRFYEYLCVWKLWMVFKSLPIKVDIKGTLFSSTFVFFLGISSWLEIISLFILRWHFSNDFLQIQSFFFAFLQRRLCFFEKCEKVLFLFSKNRKEIKQFRNITQKFTKPITI